MSFHFGKGSLLLGGDDNLLINGHAFLFADVLDDELGRIRREDVSFAVLFSIFISRGDVEWVIGVDLPSVEHELWICYPRSFFLDAIVECEAFSHRQ